MHRLQLPFVLLVLVFAGCGSPVAQQPTLAVSVEPSPPTGPMMENPNFKTWEQVPLGTRIRLRTINETEGNVKKSVTNETYTLVKKSADLITLEWTTHMVRHDGYENTVPPSEQTIPKMIPDLRDDKSKTTMDQEKITVHGTEYQTKTYATHGNNEGGKMITQTWISDQVPGQLVKSVTRTPDVGKITTIELMDVQSPKE